MDNLNPLEGTHFHRENGFTPTNKIRDFKNFSKQIEGMIDSVIAIRLSGQPRQVCRRIPPSIINQNRSPALGQAVGDVRQNIQNQKSSKLKPGSHDTKQTLEDTLATTSSIPKEESDLDDSVEEGGAVAEKPKGAEWNFDGPPVEDDQESDVDDSDEEGGAVAEKSKGAEWNFDGPPVEGDMVIRAMSSSISVDQKARDEQLKELEAQEAGPTFIRNTDSLMSMEESSGKLSALETALKDLTKLEEDIKETIILVKQPVFIGIEEKLKLLQKEVNIQKANVTRLNEGEQTKKTADKEIQKVKEVINTLEKQKLDLVQEIFFTLNDQEEF